MDVQGGDLPVTPQSGRSHVPAAVAYGQRVGPLARELELALTFVLAPRDDAGLLAKAEAGQPTSLAEVDSAHRPDAAAVGRVLRWCAERGLEAVASTDGYMVEARGLAPDVERALGIRLDQYLVGRVRGHAPRGEPQLPSELSDDVLAVLGVANLARPWRGRPLRKGGAAGASGPATGAGYLPPDIRAAYGLPDPGSGVDGRGETVAVFEFGSAFAQSDLSGFWQLAGVTPPTVESVWALGPGQAPPETAPSMSADVEATSDVQWIGALAPAARIVVVNGLAGSGADSFAQGLARAMSAALQLNPQPSVVSISYGDAEAFFAPAELLALDTLYARAAAAGVTVVVASGDSGAYGVPVPAGALESVDAPACLPHALAVGGTHLELADGVVAREIAWSDTNGGNGASGGGVSQVFAVPAWQDAGAVASATAGGQGRGVPDVSADADPVTGYRIVIGGALSVVGGTSLAAPVWAAALTLVNQVRHASGEPSIGLAAPQLYPFAPRPTRIRDILVGDNAFLSAPGYRCCTGWDAVTGIGAPAGPALWQGLAGQNWPTPSVRRADPAPPQVIDAAPAVAAIEAAEPAPAPSELEAVGPGHAEDAEEPGARDEAGPDNEAIAGPKGADAPVKPVAEAASVKSAPSQHEAEPPPAPAAWPAAQTAGEADGSAVEAAEEAAAAPVRRTTSRRKTAASDPEAASDPPAPWPTGEAPARAQTTTRRRTVSSGARTQRPKPRA